MKTRFFICGRFVGHFIEFYFMPTEARARPDSGIFIGVSKSVFPSRDCGS